MPAGPGQPLQRRPLRRLKRKKCVPPLQQVSPAPAGARFSGYCPAPPEHHPTVAQPRRAPTRSLSLLTCEKQTAEQCIRQDRGVPAADHGERDAACWPGARALRSRQRSRPSRSPRSLAWRRENPSPRLQPRSLFALRRPLAAALEPRSPLRAAAATTTGECPPPRSKPPADLAEAQPRAGAIYNLPQPTSYPGTSFQ